MPTPISMPKLGMSMAEGRVVSWSFFIGDYVEKGQVVLVIESEKAEIEIEAIASGYFRHVYVDPEETVPCGTLLAVLCETADETIDLNEFRREHDRPEIIAKSADQIEFLEPKSTPGLVRHAPGRQKITPAARALARQEGLDLGPLIGTGPGGRITREDVESFVASRAGLIEVEPGVGLEVTRTGEGETVLLLPGFGSDISVFTRQTAELSRCHHVVGVHPRGVGLSDAPDEVSYGVVQAAKDAAAVTDGSLHVVGASLGAAVALELAFADPSRIRSLTLITPILVASPRLLAVLEVWTELRALCSAQTLARVLLPWFFSGPSLDGERSRDRLARGLAACVDRVSSRVLERTLAGLRFWSGSRGSDVASLTMPVLIVTGEFDLLTMDGLSMATMFPNVSHLPVAEAGHAVALEAPEIVSEAILAHTQAA